MPGEDPMLDLLSGPQKGSMLKPERCLQNSSQQCAIRQPIQRVFVLVFCFVFCFACFLMRRAALAKTTTMKWLQRTEMSCVRSCSHESPVEVRYKGNDTTQKQNVHVRFTSPKKQTFEFTLPR